MEAQDYVRIAKTRILLLLAEQQVLAPGEVFARLSDASWAEPPWHIDPHHLRVALRELEAGGDIARTTGATRGGKSIQVIHLADLSRRKTKVVEAARRKRLLYSRFLGWAEATVRYPRGLLGPAGEKVLYNNLVELSPQWGYKLERPEGGDVATLFGSDVPGGPIDSVLHIPLLDDFGLGQGTVVGLVEVKNIREWMYRDDLRLHQLLYKAAALQRNFPKVAFLPILVCRRAQQKTYEMAKALGFFVAAAKTQFLVKTGEITPRALAEVQGELGFRDLAFDDQTRWQKLLRSYFAKAIPANAKAWADNWKSVGSKLVNVYEQLRLRDLSREERNVYMTEIFEVLNPADEPDEDELSYPDDA